MTVFASPQNEAELQQAIADALASSTKLRIVGGGTRGAIGQPLDGLSALDMSQLSGVTKYEPGSLSLVAKAGTPMAEIEALLASENQMFAFEPMDHRSLLGSAGEPTIGGVVAGNVSGPRRFLVGACRDHLLGVRFVEGRGQLIKNGGQVMKNVTGLDLVKLSAGAYGTLGALSEVSFKVLPRAERAITLCFADVSEAEAVGIFCQAVGTPFEVSGAAWRDGTAYLRIEGLAAQVDYRRTQLVALLKSTEPSVLEGEDHQALWQQIRDVSGFAQEGDSVWRLSVKPTQAPALVAAAQTQLRARAQLDQAGGLVWLAIPSEDPAQATILRALLQDIGAHATLIKGSAALRAAVPVFQPLAPRLEQISEGLRRKFDPHALFNPGLMTASPLNAGATAA